MTSPNSLRPTREWPLLVLSLALVLAVCVPLWQWSLAGQQQADEEASAAAVARWTPDRIARLLLGPEQIACYAAFTWALLILAGRYFEVRRQHRAFGLELLPPGQCILARDAWELQRRIDDRVGRKGPFILAGMLRLALAKFASSRSSRDVGEVVRSQGEVDLGRLVSSMGLVHYLAWAIPAIGFLGTVRGLAGSLTLGGETKLAIAAFIREATGHLNVAFDCTLVALALSLVLMFLLHAVQREEEGLVLECQQFCLDHLVSRLYDVPAEQHHHSTPLSPTGTLDDFVLPTMAPSGRGGVS